MSFNDIRVCVFQIILIFCYLGYYFWYLRKKGSKKTPISYRDWNELKQKCKISKANSNSNFLCAESDSIHLNFDEMQTIFQNQKKLILELKEQNAKLSSENQELLANNTLPDEINSLKEEIEKLNKEIVEIKEEKRELSSNLEKSNERINNYLEDNQKFQSEIRTLRKQNENLHIYSNENHKLLQENKALAQSNHDLSKCINDLKQKNEEQKNRIKDCEQQMEIINIELNHIKEKYIIAEQNYSSERIELKNQIDGQNDKINEILCKNQKLAKEKSELLIEKKKSRYRD